MTLNPVISLLGRKLRLAMIGGGPGSFIGAMHRLAARVDDRYDLVAGAFSSDPQKSRLAGLQIGLDSERAYTNALALIEAETSRDDGVDVVAIMTPNDSHYPYAMAALENGMDVICDKPMTNTLQEAETLYRTVQETGLVFCLTHNYTGYPMVRQAKAMVEDGQLGTIILVQVEYVQGGRAEGNDPDPSAGSFPWRFDPQKSGPSLVMGDIGSHAHNLIRFITGLEIDQVSAQVGHIVPNRIVDDYAGVLLRLDNGARGVFWATQAAAGVENCLRIRVSGTLGTLEWEQEMPQRLVFKPLKKAAEVRTPNGPGTLPLAGHSSRIVAGHPEGFPMGFANLYADAALAIAARRSSTQTDPLSLYFPNAYDGLMGIRFIDSVLRSNNANGEWVKC